MFFLSSFLEDIWSLNILAIFGCLYRYFVLLYSFACLDVNLCDLILISEDFITEYAMQHSLRINLMA